MPKKVTFLSRYKPLFIPHSKEAKLYLINLEDIKDEEVCEAEKYLDKKTLERANKYTFFEEKKKRILVYATLRFHLEAFLKQKASKIELLQNSYGKLYIRNNPVHFNISHTKQYALLAFHSRFPIGVDIEKVRNIPDILELADRFLHPEEKIQLTNSENIVDSFFSLWCSKEAFLKATPTCFDELPDLNLNIDLEQDKDQLVPIMRDLYLWQACVESHRLAVCVNEKTVSK